MKKQLNSDIMKSFNYPIRMCIVCKNRLPQKDLFRFQKIDGNIVGFTKRGRSFYICESCMDSDRKIKKILREKFKIYFENTDKLGKILKELGRNG